MEALSWRKPERSGEKRTPTPSQRLFLFKSALDSFCKLAFLFLGVFGLSWIRGPWDQEAGSSGSFLEDGGENELIYRQKRPRQLLNFTTCASSPFAGAPCWGGVTSQLFLHLLQLHSVG